MHNNALRTSTIKIFWQLVYFFKSHTEDSRLLMSNKNLCDAVSRKHLK